jgi:hypothetical protein
MDKLLQRFGRNNLRKIDSGILYRTKPASDADERGKRGKISKKISVHPR